MSANTRASCSNTRCSVAVCQWWPTPGPWRPHTSMPSSRPLLLVRLAQSPHFWLHATSWWIWRFTLFLYILQKRLAWALFALLLSTLVCCQPSLDFFCFIIFQFYPPPPTHTHHIHTHAHTHIHLNIPSPRRSLHFPPNRLVAGAAAAMPSLAPLIQTFLDVCQNARWGGGGSWIFSQYSANKRSSFLDFSAPPPLSLSLMIQPSTPPCVLPLSTIWWTPLRTSWSSLVSGVDVLDYK